MARKDCGQAADGYGHGYGYGGMGGGGFAGLFIFLFVALGVTAIALLIIWAVRVSRGHHAIQPSTATGDSHNEAVAVAKLRLAKGEITPEQYQEIMRVLGS
jgi:putative membrane protein